MRGLFGNFGEAGKVVGGIGKHDVECGRRGGDESQCVGADEREVVGAELCDDFVDEALLGGCLFDSGDPCTFAREELEGYGASSGEKVEYGLAFEVGYVFEDVEDVFFCEVGSRPRGDVGGYVEASASVFASDYSHRGMSVRGNGACMASLPSLKISDGKMTGMT